MARGAMGAFPRAWLSKVTIAISGPVDCKQESDT